MGNTDDSTATPATEQFPGKESSREQLPEAGRSLQLGSEAAPFFLPLPPTLTVPPGSTEGSWTDLLRVVPSGVSGMFCSRLHVETLAVGYHPAY